MEEKRLSDSINLVRQLFLEGNYIESKRLCLEILMKRPEDLNILYLLGQTYWELGNKEEAVSYFIKCTELNSHAVGATRYIGIFFFEKKEYKLAIQSFLSILSHKPDITSHQMLSIIYLLLGLTDEAFMHASDACALDPKNKLLVQQMLINSLFCDKLHCKDIFDLHLE